MKLLVLSPVLVKWINSQISNIQYNMDLSFSVVKWVLFQDLALTHIRTHTHVRSQEIFHNRI